MAATGEADDNQLTGRLPRPVRREARAAAPEPEAGAPAEVTDPEPDLPDDHEIETVNRLMGFLRGDT